MTDRRDDDQDQVLADWLDEGVRYDTPDIKGQHRLVVANITAGDRRYLVDLPGAGIYGEAVCGKCTRFGIDLSLVPCTTGAFGTGEEI